MLQKITLGLTATLISGSVAFAIGSDDETEQPVQTETVTECKDGEVYDEKEESCQPIKESQLSDKAILKQASAMMHFGRPLDAVALLSRASNSQNSEILTSLGFAHRKSGRFDLAFDYYAQALKVDPSSALTRSYLGMAYVELGLLDQAETQLQQIAFYSDSQSWPYRALKSAIERQNDDY